MPTSRGDALRRPRAVAGEQHRRRARAPSARATASALVGLTVSRTLERRARLAVPGDRRSRRRCAPTATVVGPRRAPRTPTPGTVAERRRPAAASPTSARAARGDRPRDRMLARGLDRAGEPQHLRARRRRSSSATSDELHPALGDRAGLVEHDRVDAARLLEDLRAADQDAELRAAAGADHQRGRRREPERARAGDDQHGDGGRERRVDAEPPDASQPASVASESTITTGTKTAETRSASRCTGALPDCASLDEPRDLRERRVGADPRRAHDEPPVAC